MILTTLRCKSSVIKKWCEDATCYYTVYVVGKMSSVMYVMWPLHTITYNKRLIQMHPCFCSKKISFPFLQGNCIYKQHVRQWKHIYSSITLLFVLLHFSLQGSVDLQTTKHQAPSISNSIICIVNKDAWCTWGWCYEFPSPALKLVFKVIKPNRRARHCERVY